MLWNSPNSFKKKALLIISFLNFLKKKNLEVIEALKQSAK